MSDGLSVSFYAGAGLVCVFLGLTFLGGVYTELRCRYWRVVSGVVIGRGVRRSRSISSVDSSFHNESSGEAVLEHAYVTVQVEVDGRLTSFEFAAHADQINDEVRVCVHPRFPQLFYCRYPESLSGWRRIGESVARGLMLLFSVLLLGTGLLLVKRFLF